ncbi:hypothetical protein PanWU01x14_196050 [Parasponia andersonii]|uniref:Uncharacterized protein n=1 Tax=Parasponia andersonii TaxID=3476 RepID=A0A2P5C041_PARAD|nr:hypothetical protein PanWU01x14_196050 [Parasponia andersonii]
MVATRCKNNSQVGEITSRLHADYTGDLPTRSHGSPTMGVVVEQPKSSRSRGSSGTYAMEIATASRRLVHNESYTLRTRRLEMVARAATIPRVRDASLLDGFKMPTITPYEGKIDPCDHLDSFNDLMDLSQVQL